MAEENESAEAQGIHDPLPNEVLTDSMELGGDADDRSSSLSDIEDRVMADVVENHLEEHSGMSEDDDTEAETERLEASPQKDRKQKTINLKPMQADAGRNTTSVEKQIAVEEEPTSSISSFEDSITSSSRHSPQTSSPKKRKISRDESMENDRDRTTASLNKVSKNLAAHLKSSPTAIEANVPSKDSIRHQKSPSAKAPTLSLPHDPKSAFESQAVSAQRSLRASHDHEIPSTKVQANTGNSNRGQTHEDEAATMDGNDSTISNDEDGENADGDGEIDGDVAMRNDEEAVKKTSAMKSLNELEQCFAHLRDKLYDDRLTQYNNELSALRQPNPTHPEYLAMMACVDKKRDDQIEYEQELCRLKSDLIKRNSVADRAVAISQYVQTARQIREDILEKANEEWYQLQRERRTHNSDQTNYTYAFKKKRSQQIINQMAYNTEVSILSGIAKHVGFPAAPEITCARPNDVEDDLRAMEEAKVKLYPALETARPAPAEAQLTQPFRPPQFNRMQSSLLGQARTNPVAEEQFLEQTPWANPQHPAHQQQQMNPAFRRFSHQQRPHSPYRTPAAQHRDSENINHGSASTIPDGFSAQGSSMAATPATGENNNMASIHRAGPYQETPSRAPPSELQGSLLNGSDSRVQRNGIEEARAYVTEPSPALQRTVHEEGSCHSHKTQTSKPHTQVEPVNAAPLAPFQSAGV